jgi:hypothetical protein
LWTAADLDVKVRRQRQRCHWRQHAAGAALEQPFLFLRHRKGFLAEGRPFRLVHAVPVQRLLPVHGEVREFVQVHGKVKRRGIRARVRDVSGGVGFRAVGQRLGAGGGQNEGEVLAQVHVEPNIREREDDEHEVAQDDEEADAVVVRVQLEPDLRRVIKVVRVLRVLILIMRIRGVVRVIAVSDNRQRFETRVGLEYGGVSPRLGLSTLIT